MPVRRALQRCSGGPGGPCASHSSSAARSPPSGSPSRSRSASTENTNSGDSVNDSGSYRLTDSEGNSDTVVPDGVPETEWSGLGVVRVQKCEHGQRAILKKCWGGKHTGRRFLGCPVKDEAEKCQFMEWLDEPWSERVQECLKELCVSPQDHQLRFEAVVHFAGLKAVGESVHKPLLYYDNNLIGTITLLEVMAAHGCKKLVFSSSATVYGWPKEVPCTEEFPLCATNPYGRTKLMIEDICRDVQRSDPDWKIILLRYFNPVGAHPSGYIGEDPCGVPNNLMPYVQQVAVGRLPHLTVYGTDYNTKDGTGVRDYIHVVDLADGHIAALRKLYEDSDKIGCEVYNLGTGKGTSVLEMVAAFEKVSGKKIPLVLAGRRPGDAEIVYAATAKAEKELKWKAKYGVDEMCRDLWIWASKNPYGYAGSPDKSN